MQPIRLLPGSRVSIVSSLSSVPATGLLLDCFIGRRGTPPRHRPTPSSTLPMVSYRPALQCVKKTALILSLQQLFFHPLPCHRQSHEAAQQKGNVQGKERGSSTDTDKKKGLDRLPPPSPHTSHNFRAESPKIIIKVTEESQPEAIELALTSPQAVSRPDRHCLLTPRASS